MTEAIICNLLGNKTETRKRTGYLKANKYDKTFFKRAANQRCLYYALTLFLLTLLALFNHRAPQNAEELLQLLFLFIPTHPIFSVHFHPNGRSIP